MTPVAVGTPPTNPAKTIGIVEGRVVYPSGGPDVGERVYPSEGGVEFPFDRDELRLLSDERARGTEAKT